jgi:hypothetical protein
MSKRQDPKNNPAPKRKATKPAVVGIDPVKTDTTKGIAGSRNNSLGIQDKGGRPSILTPEVIAVIADRLAVGEPLACICRDAGMPSARSVARWTSENTWVSATIAGAREDGEEYLMAECLTIADSATATTAFGGYDGGHIQEKKLRIETRLKLLAKWNPKKYGDKLDLTSGGERLNTEVIRPHVPKE